MSPNYPSNYGAGESCDITWPSGAPIFLAHFATESGYDELYIDGGIYSMVYSGTSTVVPAPERFPESTRAQEST